MSLLLDLFLDNFLGLFPVETKSAFHSGKRIFPSTKHCSLGEHYDNHKNKGC